MVSCMLESVTYSFESSNEFMKCLDNFSMGFRQGDDSFLPVCSVSCTVHLQLFTNLIYYRLGQNQLIINKYAVRSRYSLWPIQLLKD